MNLAATSSLFHLWIDIKRQLLEHCQTFAKPHCMCLTTLPEHESFWRTCTQVFTNMDELASLALQILCETNHCLCLEKPETKACFDSLFQLSQSLFFVLSQYKDHRQRGSTLSMLENQQLAYNLDSIAKRGHLGTSKLLRILQQCSQGHSSLVSKYTACAMEE